MAYSREFDKYQAEQEGNRLPRREIVVAMLDWPMNLLCMRRD